MLQVFDLPDVQRMVAGGVGIHHLTDKVGQGIGQNRVVMAALEPDLQPFYRPAREMAAIVLLIVAQDADCIAAGLLQ